MFYEDIPGLLQRGSGLSVGRQFGIVGCQQRRHIAGGVGNKGCQQVSIREGRLSVWVVRGDGGPKHSGQ